MMRTPRRLLTALTATAAATAAIVAVSSPAAQAAPPQPAKDTVAPYAGPATFTSYTNQCYEGASCEVTGSADAMTGRGTATAAFRRLVPGGGNSESVYGSARQEVSYQVPPGARSVTAVLTWRVASASASAVASAGTLYATSGVAGAIDGCELECSTLPDQRQMAASDSTYGIPSVPTYMAAPRTESLTLTASGKLPRTLLLRASAYVIGGGYGELEPCLNYDGCDTLWVAHAGTVDAHVDATLLSVRISTS